MGRPEPAARSEPAARPDHAPRGETTHAEPAPRPAPERPRSQIVSDIQRELLRLGLYDGPVNGKFGNKTAAALREFEKHAGLPPTGEPNEAIVKTMTRAPLGSKSASASPPAANAPAEPSAASPRAAPGGTVTDPPEGASRAAAVAAPTVNDPPALFSAKRMKAVQQALADFGYGQVKPTGNPDAATRAAIEEFETVHKLPVTGQISKRFLRELVAVTDRPLE